MAPDPLSPFRIADLTTDGEGPTLMPQIDVSETERELKIDAELPGLSDNEIEASFGRWHMPAEHVIEERVHFAAQ